MSNYSLTDQQHDLPLDGLSQRRPALDEQLQLNATVQDAAAAPDTLRVLHTTIHSVTRDTETLNYNRAIARMMGFVNHFTKQDFRARSVLDSFVLLLASYAHHLCEEPWQLLGHSGTLAYEAWPEFNESLAVDDQIKIPIQFKGKVRSKITVPADISQDELEAAARADKRVADLFADQK